MGRQFGAKPTSLARVLVVVCVTILGFALIADIFWASSSKFTSSYFNTIVSNQSPHQPSILPKNNNPRKPIGDIPGRVLSATFQDLPGPELKWEKMATAPVPRLDGAAIQIKDLLYVFAGYGTIDYVHSHVDIYNFMDNTWGGRFDMPKEMAHSHLGMVTDGRYIYVISGQYGPQCRGPTSRNFVLDTETKRWQDLPPLPVPRYAPATQLWRGRLHVMGGSKENRHTPGLEHWSLAVRNGKALEKEWRTEIPIPRGGPHSCMIYGLLIPYHLSGWFLSYQISLRACVVVNDQLLVIGGQEGDFMAKPGSPIFKCSRRNEVVYDDVYMLDDEMKWKVLPPMPKPDSHIEFAWALVNNSIVLVGGTTEKHPTTKKMVLIGEVMQFNLNNLVSPFNPIFILIIHMHTHFDQFVAVKEAVTYFLTALPAAICAQCSFKWSVIGKLPYRVKTTLVGFWNGWLYFTSGQRDKGPDNPSPKKVLGEMWRTKLKLNL
ncbi:hypothetical protein EZV62_004443 [Acer yangbiense]|uniref:Kelch repeat-containing protein n=1 Tax=Acer yangbiense TaxID=1000413 RepID=A0A5C7IJZ0_9ROSI|nr:hypothetical protein EZV62_004443 [Acer yangbiense]